MKKIILLIFVTFPVLELIAQNNVNVKIFTDKRDGKIYKTVKIGNQLWMAQNLNYSIGNCWCYNCKAYGRLYDWETAKRACPKGWHLPSNNEWQTLIDYLGGNSIAGGKLKSTKGWNWPNTGATNSSGYTALPGGWFINDGSFGHQGDFGYWWSATEYNDIDAWSCSMGFNDTDASLYFIYPMDSGFSVRCIKSN